MNRTNGQRILGAGDGGGYCWGSTKIKEECPSYPRAWRSIGSKQTSKKSLVKVIDKEGFNFRPYICTPRGTAPVNLFALHNQRSNQMRYPHWH